jgi:hypothetical protein
MRAIDPRREALRQITVRIDDTKSPSCSSILACKVLDQGGLARPGLSDDVEMKETIR